MTPATLRELDAMAAKLAATARKLPQGQERQNAFREISKFRDRIAALSNGRSAKGVAPQDG